MGKLDKNIIAKYLAGECSEPEIIQVRNWISSSSGNKELFLDDQKVWNEVEKISSKFASINLEKELEVYMNQIQTLSSPEDTNSITDSYFSSKNKHISFRPWLKYAAIFLIVLNIVGIVGFFVIRKTSLQNLYSEISVPNGSVSKFVLPDGTHVWLNAGSKLRYVKNFDQKVREVFLEGEGYFIVAKDPKRPFLVEASNLTIRDIGTEFDVQCYPNEHKIETTLVKGLIKVTKANGKDKHTDVMLKPNQKLTFVKETGTLYIAGDLKKTSKKVSAAPSVDQEIKKEREEQV
ncbi:MAG: FecR family protein, partial [Bacteroidota bacterium]|nr:FecR family protein [Bacteroidota bacterium]